MKRKSYYNENSQKMGEGRYVKKQFFSVIGIKPTDAA